MADATGSIRTGSFVCPGMCFLRQQLQQSAVFGFFLPQQRHVHDLLTARSSTPKSIADQSNLPGHIA